MDCAAKALPGWPQGRMILIQSPGPSMFKDLQLRDRGSQGPPRKTARCQPHRGIRKFISWQVQEPQSILESSRKKEFAWNNPAGEIWWVLGFLDSGQQIRCFQKYNLKSWRELPAKQTQEGQHNGLTLCTYGNNQAKWDQPCFVIKNNLSDEFYQKLRN